MITVRQYADKYGISDDEVRALHASGRVRGRLMNGGPETLAGGVEMQVAEVIEHAEQALELIAVLEQALELIAVLEQSAEEREAENVALYWRCVAAEAEARRLKGERSAACAP